MKRRPAIALCASAMFVMLTPAPARAAVSLTAELAEITPWLTPEETLRVSIAVTNSGSDPATDLKVSLAVHEGIDTRFRLESTFQGKLGPVVVSDTVPVEGEIAPGETRTIQVEKPLPEIRFFSSSAPSRAYPVRMVVRSSKATAPALDTHVVFFARPPAVPLGVVFVLPIHSAPVQDPQGRVVSDSLQKSITSGGISAILAALEAHPDAPVVLAPSAQTVETLSDLADGFASAIGGQSQQSTADDPIPRAAASALARLAALAKRAGTRTVASTFTRANLVWLDDAGLSEHTRTQIAEGRLSVRSLLPSAPMEGWVLPTDGAVSEAVLDDLLRTGVDRIIVGPQSLPRSRASFSRAAPVELRTPSGAVLTALISDSGLTARLGPATELSPAQARQRVLAETATIMLERPSDRRVIVALAPANWAPGFQELDGILAALERSPWMRGFDPDEAVTQVRSAGQLEVVAPAAILAAGTDPPGESYLRAVERAGQRISEYADLGPPADRLRKLQRNTMIAESEDWWPSHRLQSRGLQFAETVDRTISSEFSKIKAPASQIITLTSRTGVIPLVVSARTDYPVKVEIRLESDKLRFPHGNRLSQLLQPPAQTIDLDTVTEASGTFPLRVVIVTPNRGIEIDSSRLVVRSTAYNVVAMGITTGAGLFILAWWVVGGLRRRFRI